MDFETKTKKNREMNNMKNGMDRFGEQNYSPAAEQGLCMGDRVKSPDKKNQTIPVLLPQGQ